MSNEEKEVVAPPAGSDDEDDDLFADSDDEKDQTEEEPKKSPTQITKSIVAAIKTEPVSAPETSKPEPQAVPVAVKQENTAPKPASNNTYASIPRKSATPSSPTTAPEPSSPPKVSSPIPKKTVSSPSDASPSATAADKYGLPKETIIPSSIREDIMRFSGGKTLDTLRSLKDIKLINDALQEYDDAVKLKGNSIRNHGAYLLGVVKRYVSVQERAARSGGASIPMGNELTPPVHQRLQKLVQDGICSSEDTRDDKVQAKLKMLSEKDALAAIEEMASVDRSSVRNFGSYFMGILNRYMRGEKQQQERNQSRRGRTNTKQDPNEMYRRERSRDRSNSGDNYGSYGPRGSQRGNNNPHLANYDNRRSGGGGPSYYGNNNKSSNSNSNQHQYPPTSRYQNNSNGPPPPAMGRLPPPPPPPPQRQSNGLPPPPPTQYQAPPQAPQIQQPQPPPQSQYGQQQPPPSHYGVQQPPPNPSYGQQQQPHGAQQQQQPPNNSYYGSQQQQQQQPYGTVAPSPYGGAPQQQPYGTAAPSPYGGAPQQQQQQQPYMQQQQQPQSVPPATNGYQQQPQQQSQWQQPAAAQGGSSMPAGIVDILGIADKAASAVQALQSQNRGPNVPQQQPQAPVQPQQQQYQQPPPQQAPPMQQQQYQPQQSYQQQQPPPQQQYQQQQPPQPQGNNQYNRYGAPPSPYGAPSPSPYAPQQAPPMVQPHQQQHNRYQNQQQQQNYNQPPYQGGQYPPPQQGYPQHQQQSHGNQNRGNRQGRGKPRRTTAQLHELPMSVQNMVHQIQNTRQVDGPLDEGILGMVKDLPEHMALQSLQKFMSIDKKSMRSKTAYLAGVLRRELERIHRR